MPSRHIPKRDAGFTHVVIRHGSIVAGEDDYYAAALAKALNEQYQTDEYTVEPFDASKWDGWNR